MHRGEFRYWDLAQPGIHKKRHVSEDRASRPAKKEKGMRSASGPRSGTGW